MKKTFLCIMLIIVMIIVALANWKAILKNFYKTDYQEYVEKYAKECNIDPYMIYAIIKAESNFNVGATSNKGALGLMQLMDNTAKEVAENTITEYVSGETLYNPEKNIMLGVTYFADLKAMFKEDAIAIAAYNAGSGNVTSWINNGTIKSDGSDIENIPFKETNLYVRKILKDYKIYKELYES